MSDDTPDPFQKLPAGLGEHLSSLQTLAKRLDESLHEAAEVRDLTERALRVLNDTRALEAEFARLQRRPDHDVGTGAFAPVTAALHGARVLLVEDDGDSREVFTALLCRHGAEVEAVATAQEAIEVLQRRRADLIVSDIRLPDVPGHSLIRLVRAWAPDRGGLTPALALTAYPTPQDRATAYAAGFNSYVPKPAADELVDVAAALIGMSAGQPPRSR